jgi:hypothetical protein
MRWILACAVLLVLALIWEHWLGGARPLPAAPEGSRSSEPSPSSAERAELETARAGEREDLAPGEQAAAPAESADDLLELLRRVALAYAAQDAPVLGATLEQLLRTPARCEETLLLLEQGGLAGDELARSGAVFVLGAAVSCYASANSSIRRTVAVDARAFTERVLEGLARVLPPEQQDLAEQLIQAQDGERYVLDLSYLAKILELRGRHPEQAEVYSSLLVHMAENLSDPGGLEQFRALFLGAGEDPTAVQISLSALLRTDASSWLPLAEDLFADARDRPALRSAIAQAIATSAPVETAAAALTRLANPGLYQEFALLGLREGGAEALAARYSELVGSNGNPVARRMLVSGLRSEAESVLVGIARTDPDSAVRTQALLTSSLGRASGPELLDELVAQHSLRGDPQRGIGSLQTVLVAGNVLVNSDAPERERAKDLLLTIAADVSESDADRLAAVRMLKPWMPSGTFDGWVIGGQPLK